MLMTFTVRATHIVGADLTYEHIQDNKYKVFATIYRDCAECKLAGGGGGSNTTDCGKFDLYLKSSGKNGCTPAALATFSLQRTSIDQIIPVCPTVQTLCETDNDLQLGIEAHVFYAIVDFAAYESYKSCGYDLYINLSSRSDDIDNITGESNGDLRLYVDAYIDPFAAIHNSPLFYDDPQVILAANQPVRTYLSKGNYGTDSISVHLSSAYRDYNKTVTYASGYSKDKPLTVWCNGSSACTPDPTANPPIGMYVNNSTSAFIFTPTQTAEKATLAYSIERWRKINGSLTLLSRVSRDVLVEVLAFANNAPSFKDASYDLIACAGANSCFIIEASDLPFQKSDGSYKSQNNVSFEWTTNAPNISISEISSSSAPYKKLRICWQAHDSLVRDEPFMLSVKISDNDCPLPLSATANYSIFVKPQPDMTISTKKLWCGNIEVSAKSSAGQSIKHYGWSITDSNSSIFGENRAKDTLLVSRSGTYKLNLRTINVFGCETTQTINLPIKPEDIQVFNFTITGKTAICLRDTLKLTAVKSGIGTLNRLDWIVLSTDTLGTGNSISIPVLNKDKFNNGIALRALGSLGELQCVNNQVVPVSVDAGPELSLNHNFHFCPNVGSVNLNTLISGAKGKWTEINHNSLMNDSIIDPNSLLDLHIPHVICQRFDSEPNARGCSSFDTLCIVSDQLPILQLEDRTICQTIGTFNLNNIVVQPFGLETYTLEWEINGDDQLVEFINNRYVLDISNLNFGSNEVIAQLTNEFGCSVYDTTELIVRDKLVITDNGAVKFCQMNEDRSLNDMFKINPRGGIWSSIQFSEMVIDNMLDKDFCGLMTLTYTYDIYGCYDSKDFTVEIDCKTKIDFDIPDTVCADLASVFLKASPAGGTFTGPGVSGNYWLTSGLSGNVLLRYNYIDDGCNFEYYLPIYVHPSPNYAIDKVLENICEGDTIFLNNIQILNGTLSVEIPGGIITSYAEGKYNLTYVPTAQDIIDGSVEIKVAVLGIGSCPTQDFSYTVAIRPIPSVLMTANKEIECAPYLFRPAKSLNPKISNWSDVDLTWDFGDPQSGLRNFSTEIQASHEYRDSGLYSVRITTTSVWGCSYSAIWEDKIEVYPSPTAFFTRTPQGSLSFRNPEVTFINSSSGTPPLTYHWDFGTGRTRDTSNVKSPKHFFLLDTGNYPVRLTTTNQYGCSDSYTENVHIALDIQIFVPTAFTPKTSLQLNDNFGAVGYNVESYHIIIQSKWGHIVFESNDINERWDGKFGGKDCEVGVYGYKINATSQTGSQYDFSGTVNLLR